MPYNFTLENISNTIKRLGYAWFDQGLMNVNIIGIRNNTNNKVTNHFDDFLFMGYKTSVGWQSHLWPITTDPGLHWVKKPMVKEGVAILKPGQYRGVYKLDKHQGKYLALCQRNGPVQVYRDGNLNEVYDLNPNTVQTGYFGINIHRTNPYNESIQIDKWSAGCQVFKNPNHFDQFMDILEDAAEEWGNKFTYTLINKTDLVYGR